MTALAMIIGMIPMALGMGEGGEQNAPLGRAVIGGLIVATIATLTFFPPCSGFCTVAAQHINRSCRPASIHHQRTTKSHPRGRPEAGDSSVV